MRISVTRFQESPISIDAGIEQVVWWRFSYKAMHVYGSFFPGFSTFCIKTSRLSCR